MNEDIRLIAFRNNVKMYQIADELGIHYVTLNGKLRKKLQEEERQQIINIINKLKKEEK